MAGSKLLKWLYRHSPVNFYSITEENETIIKSINNTSTGYKFNKLISNKELGKLRKVCRFFKRSFAISLLSLYVVFVYGFVFPNYKLLFNNPIYALLAVITILALIPILAYWSAKLFEIYLKKHFGNFEKTHFPSANQIEQQSYKEFKLELVKISVFLTVILCAYLLIGSPSETATDLIRKEQYEDAVKMTTIWSKIIPTNPKWYSLRAYANFKLKNFGNAINDFDKAYELENDMYKPMNFDNKIYVRYFVEDYANALLDFDTEIAKSTDNFIKKSFTWDKAQFLYCIGRYKESLALYNELLQNNDNDEIYYLKNRLYYERSQVNSKLGNNKEAQSDIEMANELNLDDDFKNSIPEPTLIMNGIY